MADTKISALNAVTALASGDLFVVVDDPGGSPETKKITVDNALKLLFADMDVGGNSIVSSSNGDIAITPNGTGDVIIDGLKHPQADGTTGYFLKTDGSAQLAFSNETVAIDDTPQLGGDLDVNGQSIISASNGNIPITPNGTGRTVVSALNAAYTINAQTGTTYAPALTDAGNVMITLTNASAIAVTIPANASVAFPVGTVLNFYQGGAGAVTIGITSDTLSYDSALTAVLNGQHAVASALKLTSTTWVLFGNLTAA